MDKRVQYATGLRRVYALERERDIRGLIRMLDNSVELNPKETVRGAAASALGRLRDPAAATALALATEDPSDEVRFSAVYAIGRTRSPQAGSALLSALDDNSLDVRRAAAEALGFVGFREAIPALQQQLTAEDDWTRLYAAESLARLDDPTLRTWLPDVRARERRLALHRRKRWRALERGVRRTL